MPTGGLLTWRCSIDPKVVLDGEVRSTTRDGYLEGGVSTRVTVMCLTKVDRKGVGLKGGVRQWLI